MKRNKRRDELFISPNNLLVPEWNKPLPKRTKGISIISAIVFLGCLAIIIAHNEGKIILTDNFIMVYSVIMIITGVFSLVAPLCFLQNKIQRKMHNEEARQEILAREQEQYFV